MDRNWTKSMIRSTMKGLLALAVAGSIWSTPMSSIAAAGTDSIRVAMFLDLGSQYRSTTNAITLHSGNAMTASFGTGQEALRIASNQPTRFSVDSYRVKVLETTDWSVVSEAAKKLQATSDKPMVFADGKVYKLYTGMYASDKAASDAAARTTTAVAAQLNGQTPTVRGGWHLSAGAYGSEAQAESARAAYVGAGLDAFNVLVPTGTGVTYEVWVGEAASRSELAQIQRTAGGGLVEVDPRTPGLIIRTDVSSNLVNPKQQSHYMLSGESSTLQLSGNGSGIQVKERSERTYRGSFEVGQKNGQLYLVNELPMEQYLYSVVGAEVPSSWGAEALKAQAVAARSYALFQGNKFEVAHVVDTTLSQAYYGTSHEYDSIIAAVDATQGEVVKKDGRLVETVFSSNSGGITADAVEIWGNRHDVLTSVQSSGDASAQASLNKWYHVLLPNGVQAM
ncbi:peptidoglycan-binding domain 1 [Paenibacillus sp. JCM 10914]|nr:SpoIID/LytB domain-containing protein [Paenibacillus sp. JCM 10914]GAE03986.1 peptidoglycan-binding domain 1 [Paenibacillus sp. JCM 10914]